MSFFDILNTLSEPLRQVAVTQSFADRVVEVLKGRSFDACQAHDNYALAAATKLARANSASIVYDAVEISEHRIGIKTSCPLAHDRMV